MLNPFTYRLKTILMWHYFSKYLDKKVLIFGQYRHNRLAMFYVSDI